MLGTCGKSDEVSQVRKLARLQSEPAIRAAALLRAVGTRNLRAFFDWT